MERAPQVAQALARGWAHFVGRLDGPLHFRFVVQPLVAALIGARAGLGDARRGLPPFLWVLVRGGCDRRECLKQARADVGTVFVVAALMDAVYQFVVHAAVFTLELLFTASALALLPYALVRTVVGWLTSRARRSTAARAARA